MILLLLCVCARAEAVTTIRILSPDDVTITTLDTNYQTLTDAANSLDGSLIQAGTISSDSLDSNANPEKRWADSFDSFVATGLLPPTATGLASTTTAGRALIKNDTDNETKYVEKDATAKTYTASRWTFVDLSSAGTYTYQAVAIGAADPATTANSIRLARISTDATDVGAVRDDRVTSLSVTSNEDHYRTGLTISVTTPDTVIISPGFTRHGTTAITKTANSTLDLGTAGDWVGDASGVAASTYGFVVTSSLGSIELTATAPTLADTSENTTGKLRYVTSGGSLYRTLAWFYMNADSEIDDWGYGNFKDGDVDNVVLLSRDTTITTADTNYETMTDTSVNFYSSNGPLEITFQGSIDTVGSGTLCQVMISADSTDVARTNFGGSSGEDNHLNLSVLHDKAAAGEHSIGIDWGRSAGSDTITQPGPTFPRTLKVEEK